MRQLEKEPTTDCKYKSAVQASYKIRTLCFVHGRYLLFQPESLKDWVFCVKENLSIELAFAEAVAGLASSTPP